MDRTARFTRQPAFARHLSAVLLLTCASGTVLSAQAAPSPEQILGFAVGADRKLADWPQTLGYFARLAATVPTVRVDTLGPTTEGRPLVLVTVSSPANMRRLEQIRANQARLADPRTLDAATERRIVADQPAIVLIQCNIHSTEIASSQMAMELAWRLATIDTLQRALENVVVLIIPSANPDGMQMVVEWYRKHAGTRWDGGPMPWLYQKYVGHDNNRDWFMVTQRETQLITDLLYRRWFPGVFYDVHQQGNEGMRLTVPPLVDPVNPNVDPLIVRAISHIGSEMSLALEERGKTGVGDGVTYDLWWHGGARSTPTRHNMVGLLTEAASVRIASPITQTRSQLKGHPRGLPQYAQRVNFPNPWPGGVWRLRDIVEYELIAAEALVTMLSQQRGQYVRNFVTLGRRQLELGAAGPEYGAIIPAAQRDPAAARELIRVLRAGAVEVDARADGSAVVSYAQPYRAHVKDLLEVQRFPDLRTTVNQPPLRPYDVAGWTLPLQMGVRVEPLRTPMPASAQRSSSSSALPLPLPGCRGAPRDRFANTACYRGAVLGSYLSTREARRAGLPARIPRVALYKPWTANMDEGWTRWVLEQFDLPFVTLGDSLVRAGSLRARFDVIVLPHMSVREMERGYSDSIVPPQYAGGLAERGMKELEQFARDGGILVLLDGATELATRRFGLGIRAIRPAGDDASAQPSSDSSRASPPVDSTRGRAPAALYAPGSILRVDVDTTHALTYGMPAAAAVYFTNSVTFEVPPASKVRVVARYPAMPDSILLSGFLQGAERIAGKAALLDAPLGRGRVIMFGFRPQHRAQSYGTFKMLFNALLLGAAPVPGR